MPIINGRKRRRKRVDVEYVEQRHRNDLNRGTRQRRRFNARPAQTHFLAATQADAFSHSADHFKQRQLSFFGRAFVVRRAEDGIDIELFNIAELRVHIGS